MPEFSGGTAAIGLLGIVVTLAIAVVGAVRQGFRDLNQRSEERAVETHKRINALDARMQQRFEDVSKEIRDEYTLIKVHEADIKRIEAELSYLRRMTKDGIT